MIAVDDSFSTFSRNMIPRCFLWNIISHIAFVLIFFRVVKNGATIFRAKAIVSSLCDLQCLQNSHHNAYYETLCCFMLLFELVLSDRNFYLDHFLVGIYSCMHKSFRKQNHFSYEKLNLNMNEDIYLSSP